MYEAKTMLLVGTSTETTFGRLADNRFLPFGTHFDVALCDRFKARATAADETKQKLILPLLHSRVDGFNRKEVSGSMIAEAAVEVSRVIGRVISKVRSALFFTPMDIVERAIIVIRLSVDLVEGILEGIAGIGNIPNAELGIVEPLTLGVDADGSYRA